MVLTEGRWQGAEGREQEVEGREQEAEIVQPPVAEVTDEGEYTRDKTRLHVSWTEEPKAKEYRYAIGTTSGGVDVLDWTSAGRRTEIDASGLDLEDGKTYYITVKAKKKGLIFSKWIEVGSSDGITVDSTSPTTPLILDSGEYTTEGKELHFSWSSSDETSGIKEYLYALEGIVDWTSSGIKTELRLADLDLKDGVIYYLSVKAIDNAGNESPIGSSDGIMVDTTPPTTPVVVDDGETTTNTTTLHATWSSEDSESGIIEYQYAIGTTPGGVDVVDWTPSQEDTEIEVTGLSLLTGEAYYISVKARNRVGLWSEVGMSDGITIEAPETPVAIEEEIPIEEATPLISQ